MSIQITSVTIFFAIPHRLFYRFQWPTLSLLINNLVRQRYKSKQGIDPADTCKWQMSGTGCHRETEQTASL